MAPKKTGSWKRVRFEAGNYMKDTTTYVNKSDEVDRMRVELVEARREVDIQEEEILRCTGEIATHSKKFGRYFEHRLTAATAARATLLTTIGNLESNLERAEEEANALKARRGESRGALWEALDNHNRKNTAKFKEMADYVALEEFLSRRNGGDPIKFAIALSADSAESLELQVKLRGLLDKSGIVDLRGWEVYRINESGEISRVANEG